MLRTGLARMGSRHLGGYNWDAHLARCRSAGLATVAPPFAHRRPSRREGRNLLRPAGGPRSRAAAGARAADAQTSTIPALPQRARCPLSQYVPPRRLHANGEAFALPSSRAQAVLPCAPRARTNGSQTLRTRQSASKNPSAQQKALQKAQPTCSPLQKLFPCALASARFFWYYMLNTRAGPLARFVGECPSRARFLFVWHKS